MCAEAQTEQNRGHVGQGHRVLVSEGRGGHKLPPKDNTVSAVGKGCPGLCGVSEQGLQL